MSDRQTPYSLSVTADRALYLSATSVPQDTLATVGYCADYWLLWLPLTYGFNDPISCYVFHWLQCLLAFLLVTIIIILLQLLSRIVVLMFLVATASTLVSRLVTQN